MNMRAVNQVQHRHAILSPFLSLGPRSLASSVSAPLMTAIMRDYVDEQEEWERWRGHTPLWPEQRTICTSQGFPTRGSQGHLAEGLHNKQSNWSYPGPMGFRMEDSQVEGSLPQVAGDAHFSTQGESELRESPTWGKQGHSGMRGFSKHVGPTPLPSKALGKAQSWKLPK